MIVAKLYDYASVFIDTVVVSSAKWTRQKNKEYSFEIEFAVIPPSNAYSLKLIDTESKFRILPSGYLYKSKSDYSYTVNSWENILSSAGKIPANWQWWDRKDLGQVISDHCYGFRKISFAGLAQLQSYVSSLNVSSSEIDEGNGSVYLSTYQYLSSSELAYYESGYVIYRISMPSEARRQGMVLRWVDNVGNNTDIGIQFRWSNIIGDYAGLYSAEVSPVRTANINPNETIGVDIPEGSNSYLFIRFNLKYNSGINKENYENQITTVENQAGNIVYYGATPILNAFEVIYRTGISISPGVIDVGAGLVLSADIHGKENLLDSLKAISEAYDISFYVSVDNSGNIVLNASSNYSTNMNSIIGAISDAKNAKIGSSDDSLVVFDGCECFGAGTGIDQLYSFVSLPGVSSPRNIDRFEDSSISSISELSAAGLAYLDSKNSSTTSTSFENYGDTILQLNDTIKIVINGSIYENDITEESFTYDESGLSGRSYVVGVKKYPLGRLFDKNYDGNSIALVLSPTALTTMVTTDGWSLSWQGSHERYVVEYKTLLETQWNRIATDKNNLTIQFAIPGSTYNFRVYAFDGISISEPASTVATYQDPAATSTPLSSKMIAYYSMDELGDSSYKPLVIDNSGNGRHAVMNNVSSVSGVSGKSASFQSSDSYIDI